MQNDFYQKTVLDNGLRVVSHHIPDAKLITVVVVVNAGSLYETEETAGMAHFLEHMLFEGTKRFSAAGDLARYIAEGGGQCDAWTYREYVFYRVTILADYVDRAVDYLADVLFNSLLTEQNIEKQRGIVLDELYRVHDNIEDFRWDLWNEATWGVHHPYGRSVLGTKKTIGSFTKEGLEKYLYQFYHPSNMVLALAGGVTNQEAQKLADKYFRITNNSMGAIQADSHIGSQDLKAGIHFIEQDTNQIHVIYGFLTDVSYAHEDLLVLRLIASIFNSGSTKRLWSKLVFDLGIAYSFAVGTLTSIYLNRGELCFYGGFSQKNIEQAMQVITEEFQKLKTVGVTEEELLIGKVSHKASVFTDLQSTESIATTLALEELLENKINTPDEIEVQLASVTAEDFQRFAQRYITLDNLSVSVIGKVSAAKQPKLKQIINSL